MDSARACKRPARQGGPSFDFDYCVQFKENFKYVGSLFLTTFCWLLLFTNLMAENMAFECVKKERKSKVWIFFLLNKEERKAKCISCSHRIMMTKDGSTGNLLNHLKSNHSADFKWIKGNKNEKTKSSDKSKNFQPKIIEVMPMSLADKTENFEIVVLRKMMRTYQHQMLTIEFK